MTNKVIQSMVKDILLKYPHTVLIYQTGSRLTKVNSAQSDYDFYVFYLNNKLDFMLNSDKGNTIHGDGYEAKVFQLPHLLNLLKKSNPNVAELFFKKPVYCGDGYLSDLGLSIFLYDNRERLPLIDKRRFIASSLGMMRGAIKAMTADRVYNGGTTFGKTAYNFLKTYRYGLAVATSSLLEDEVFLESDSLETVLAIKQTATFSQKLLDSLDVETKLAELTKFNNQPETVDLALLGQIADRLPLYYTL